MGSSILVTIRTLIVLTLLLAMPLLAIPVVGNYVSSLWTGVAPESLSPEEVAGHEPPAWTVADTRSPRHSATQPAGETAMNVSTVYHPKSTGMDLRETEIASGPRTPLQSQPSSNSYLQQVHHRLKGLGASYIRLETIGTTSLQYRFHVEFPVGDSVYARTFQRTAADPAVAMERVLADVQSWYISRNPSQTGGSEFR